MDPLFQGLYQFKCQNFEKCIEKCDVLLAKNAYDQAAWCLKMKALTEQVYVDELEADEESLADIVMDDTTVAQIARPGTSIKRAPTASGVNPAIRPTTQSGRPVSGFVRPGTQSGRPGTMEQAVKTPRTAHTARPVTSSTGRFVRLGTASMLSNPDGPFINLSRLNFAKYAERQSVAKSLFEYIFYHENDVRSALQLAALATEKCQYQDWWWKLQIAKCYIRLCLYRDAEDQLKSALKQEKVLDLFLFLGKVYTRLDQPLGAIETFKQGLEKFPSDTALLTGIARLHEMLMNLDQSSLFYRKVLSTDSMNVEAIASIAANHFYSDQPEVGIKYFRRLLQMGIHNVEIFNNLGLCCFYAQQYDICLTCFEKSISLATENTIADVWFNVGHVALGIGDANLSYQCFRLSLATNNEHAEAYNNLGVLEMRRGHIDTARAFFQAAQTLAAHLYEPSFNLATISSQVGDVQSSYSAVKQALDSFPQHTNSKELLKQLEKQLQLF